MIFERRPIEQTLGTVLAHSIKLEQGSIKKGHLITAADIEVLKAADLSSIVVACLDKDDVDENLAASLLAEVLSGDHLLLDKPFTGRCNLKAARHGLIEINSDSIIQVNLVNEAITVATLLPYSVVQPGQLVATVKIIPFAVRKSDLDICINAAREHLPILRLHPFQARTVGFVQTRLRGTKESVLDKTRQVLFDRLNTLDCKMVEEIRCNHDEAEVAAAIQTHLGNSVDLVIVAGASATVDRKDIIPAAILQTGGEIIHYGMPVDPGNLLLLARHGQRTVLGMPGCARSPKLNGFDWILERLVADIPVTARDIMAMGPGGLLKEIETRPQLRNVKPRD